MEKRLVLAIAMSILIMLAFQYFIIKPTPKANIPTPTEQPVAPAVKEEIGPVISPELLAQEKETQVETDRYIMIFSNIGGAIKEIRLKDYKSMNSNESLELVKIQNPFEYMFSIDGPKAPLSALPAIYELEKRDHTIIYTLRTNEFEITKKYVLNSPKYGIDLLIFVRNMSGGPKEFNYRIIGGAGITEKSAQDKRFLEVTSNINGKTVGFKKPKAGRISTPGIVGWTALKNKYFSVVLKPFVQTKNQFYSEDKDGNLVMGITPEGSVMQPGDSIENKFKLYVGPDQISDLKEFGYGLEESVNYGFFGGISKLLIAVMRFLHVIVRNWGIAVILLSIFLNILLFPLTVKSFRSMQKMQELHPQMEKLKIQHKDNPQKMNKEVMELYKKYNINPFSGCLPMLLQMPVFIALYQALNRSIDLRNAKFLWINDLSAPDAIPLPLSFPIIGNTINILPLIMVIAMVIQQKLSTKFMGAAVTDEQREQQRMMLILMPIIFGFIFYNMPSGLVLYWVVNTVLTIFEQYSVFSAESSLKA